MSDVLLPALFRRRLEGSFVCRWPGALCAAALALTGSLSAHAMSVVKPSFHQLVTKSDSVVRVVVTGSHAQWDVTPTGQNVIHTYYDCRVLKTLKGVPSPTLSLRFLGGKVGPAVMEIPDMPTLDVGSRYILFVAGNGTAFCPLVGVMHGKFTVKAGADGAERIAESGARREDFESSISSQLRPGQAP